MASLTFVGTLMGHTDGVLAVECFDNVLVSVSRDGSIKASLVFPKEKHLFLIIYFPFTAVEPGEHVMYANSGGSCCPSDCHCCWS